MDQLQNDLSKASKLKPAEAAAKVLELQVSANNGQHGFPRRGR